MYTVTISKKTVEKRVGGEDWKQVMTEAEAKEKGGKTFGYTPKIEKLVDVNIEVFKQVVDDLGMVDVIAAINSVKM